MRQRRRRDGQILLTVADPAVVLTPAHLGRAGVQVWAGDMVMHGIKETGANLRNKIGRWGFSAAFFVKVLVAIAAHTVRLHEAD